MTISHWEVVVVGAGPAGLAATLALHRASVRSIRLVGATPRRAAAIGESVPPDIMEPLRQLGLAEQFRRGPHVDIPGTMSVWGGDAIGFKDYIQHPLGTGWRLDRRAFDGMLLDAVRQTGIEVTLGRRLAGVVPSIDADHPHRLRLRGERGEEQVTARWVVDASGAGARVAGAFGARRSVDDRLLALVQDSRGPSDIGWQTMVEACRDGWWYRARLPLEGEIVMFVTDPETITGTHPGQVWDNAAASTILVGRVRRVALQGSRRAVAIRSGALDRIAGRGWVAVGDAGWSCDPILGIGVHEALTSGLSGGRWVASQLIQDAAGASASMQRLTNRSRGCAQERARLYRLEGRWPDSGFWSRRLRNTSPALPGEATAS